MSQQPPISTPFPYTTLFRSTARKCGESGKKRAGVHQTTPVISSDIPRHVGHPSHDFFQSGPRIFVHCVFCARTKPATLHLFRRSEEHTSELQSRVDLVCRLL